MSEKDKEEFNREVPIPKIKELKEKAELGGFKFTISHDKKVRFNEVDCVGINKNGDILIFEVKKPDNDDGIVYGPMQVRYYIEQIRYVLKDKDYMPVFYSAIKDIVKQKQNFGILPASWEMPPKLSGKIIPYLIVGSENNRPNLKSNKTSEFKVVHDIFNDEDFPMQVCICSSDGTLKEYKL